jgi:WD repeat-containing protein 22
LILTFSISQDGRILRHDGRTSSRTARAQDTIQIAAEITGVQFHPIMENIFVTSDGRGVVCLRDTRMAFGPLKNRTREGAVHVVSKLIFLQHLVLFRCQYNTKLAKGGTDRLSNPEASSVAFDREGWSVFILYL